MKIQLEIVKYIIYMMIQKVNIWVCTLDNGLFKINLEDKSVHNYKNEENKIINTK